METTTAIPVTLTASAKDEIRRLMNEAGFNKDQFLRIGVKGGGCSGMTYVLGFDVKTENHGKDPRYLFNGNGSGLAGRIKLPWIYF
jgi:Fe-S cluster assembly iron-binding protein IscA